MRLLLLLARVVYPQDAVEPVVELGVEHHAVSGSGRDDEGGHAVDLGRDPIDLAVDASEAKDLVGVGSLLEPADDATRVGAGLAIEKQRLHMVGCLQAAKKMRV